MVGEAALPYSAFNDPLQWRHRAEEARAMADELSDSGAKQTMFRIAGAYDAMAISAEKRCKPTALETI
jgi:muconolactone delta-isomerase